jgi:hypothetical protein
LWLQINLIPAAAAGYWLSALPCPTCLFAAKAIVDFKENDWRIINISTAPPFLHEHGKEVRQLGSKAHDSPIFRQLAGMYLILSMT